MRRWLVAFLLALGAAATFAVAYAASAPANGDRGGIGGRYGGERGYFAIVCGFSHRNQDDPIVFFNQPGKSHDHTYFGNEATKASSTPAALRASGQTTCRLRADTAAYWAPTLFVAGRAIRPLGAVVYYVRRTLEPVQASRRTSRSSRGAPRHARRRAPGLRTGAAAAGVASASRPRSRPAQRPA